MTTILSSHQKQHLRSELLQLSRLTVKRYTGRLVALAPFVDEETGLIRVGGRLSQSEYADSKKHPMVVDSKSHLGRLLIQKAHLDTLHGGPQMTLYHLRQEYWLLGARNACKSFVRSCTTCTSFSGPRKPPMMGDLPEERITQTRPFDKTGGDFGGPLLVKLHGKKLTTEKAYIALFVCFATRAIHIELVSSLSTAACIAALRRFIARRRTPSTIYSDNGTNFVGARNELQALQFILSDDKTDSSISSFASGKGIDWVMIPPRAPHFGGLWEAGIKSCKLHLKKVVGNQLLSFEEMSTVLAQIEAILNSRPISPMSTDPNDLEALTPAHFLTGSAPTFLPGELRGPKKPR
jgi:hypothetical protein